MTRPDDGDPTRPEATSTRGPVSLLGSILALLVQYGWSASIAVLFVALYFGWLPDTRRELAEEIAASVRTQLAAVRLEMRRVSERQVRTFAMLTELCLALQRHDPKSVATCSYIYSNHGSASEPGSVP